jgi:hypothetical protein
MRPNHGPVLARVLATAVALSLAACAGGHESEGAAAHEAQAAAATPAAGTDAHGQGEAHAPAHVGLMAHQPWSRPLAPGATVAAGYLHLMNHTANPETLVAARAEGVERVEIHDMVEVDGVVQMRPVEGGVSLAVDGMVAFQPGGKHLMFFGVSRSWTEGEVVPVTLVFASGQEIELEFAVGTPAEAADEDGHAHH